jgi:LytS/YehU family sensor histidine kinase
VIISITAAFNEPFFGAMKMPPPPQRGLPQYPWKTLNNVFYNIIFSVLVIGLNMAVKITLSWMQERKNVEELQKENLQTQLALLRHQINPHFFMNTLNNIHALIDYNTEIAKDSIVKLAKMMRIMLYESENENFTVQKEIDFLKDYIELMRLRVNPNVDIRADFPEKVAHLPIAPLLFLSFIENAFKHGIKATGKSYIFVELKIDGNSLIFSCRNSKAKSNNPTETNGNIGLENSKRRLELLYGKLHQLKISETDEEFGVEIWVSVI